MNLDTNQNDLSMKAPYIFFWSISLLLFFWAVGVRGLSGSEGRWAEITREMFLTNDFFHPTINGEPYFDKPLLTYWFIGIIYWVTGLLNEWIIRIPSAVSGLLTLWATVYLGRRLWSERVGLMAGYILLTTYGVLFWSRTASADMENVAAIILAIAWYWTRREKPVFLSFLVFYLICFLGAHAKGLISVVIPILVVLPDLVREGRWRILLKSSHVFALIVGLVVYFAPFIYAGMSNPAYQSNGLALVFQENIQRYFQPFDHKGHFYTYFCYLPVLFLPWTPLLVMTLWRTVKTFRGLDRNTQWLVEAVTLVFLFFSCSGSRRSYYILPIFPFCALWVSVFINAEKEKILDRPGGRIQVALFVFVAVFEIISLVLWPMVREYNGFIPPGDLKTAALLVGILSLVPWGLYRLKPNVQADILRVHKKAAPMIVAGIILVGGFFCRQQVALDAYRGERPFAMNLKLMTKDLLPEQIAFFCTLKTNTLFYLDQPRPVRMLKDMESLQDFLTSDSGDKVLISESNCVEKLGPVVSTVLMAPPILAENSYSWQPKGEGRLMAWRFEDKK